MYKCPKCGCSRTIKERIMGQDTMDRICEACGYTMAATDFKEAYENAKTKIPIVDIYESISKTNSYVTVMKDMAINDLNIPNELYPLERFKTIEATDMIAFNSKQIIQDIENNGFALHATKGGVEIHEGVKP